MESLFILVPVALVFLLIAIRIFFWAVKSGQYDDLKTEGHRILFDDEGNTKKSADAGKPVSEHSDETAQKGTDDDSAKDGPQDR